MTADPGDQGAGQGPALSIVVVSHKRLSELALCLLSLEQQTHPRFEVILVADGGSIDIRPDLPLKRIRFDTPNISLARNAGIAAAAGPVVAFIDDDATAEPGWAEALAASFADDRVIAATGRTRGPDGLRWQVMAERVTPSGTTYPITVKGPALLGVEGGCPVGTVGTNCAFRRSALTEIGGFDPAFTYFLDESDVNMRLARRFPTGLTAIVPKAQVVHGVAAAAVRLRGGVPLDLTTIGRSAAIFAARHGGHLDDLRRYQKLRVMRQMVAGRLDPSQIAPILRTLEQGIASVRTPNPPPSGWSAPPAPDLLPMPARPRKPELHLADWHWHAATLRRQAARAVTEGQVARILLLTPSFLPHRRALTPQGWWEQHGGLWGASQPGDSALMMMPRSQRIRREMGIYAEINASHGPFDARPNENPSG